MTKKKTEQDLADDDPDRFPRGEYEFARDDEEREAIVQQWMRNRTWRK